MRRKTLPFLLALAVLLPQALPGRAETPRTPVVRVPAGTDLTSSILFEMIIPLNEIDLSAWTERQRKDVSYFVERMKRDDRIFILLQALLDPVGSVPENEALGLGLCEAVAGRLGASGVPADRMVILPPARDGGFFEAARWGPVERHQKVAVRAVQGSGWLRRREVPAVVRREIPPQGAARIDTPAPGKTDRSNQQLRGTVDPTVTSVSIVAGDETRTVAVYDGTFDVPISLRRGRNRIVVSGLDAYGRALRASVDLTYVPPRPSIVLDSPAPGATADLSRSPVITVQGSIRSRAPVASAYLVQNDIPRNIRVREDGSFDQLAVLVTDEDQFHVEALDVAGETGVSEERRVRAVGVAERPLLAILHWDENDVDIDLHVKDNAGRHTFFDAASPEESANAVASGRLWLDNRKGFGPEVFSLERDAEETFTFSAVYYRGRKACRAYLTIVLNSGSPSRRLLHVLGPIVLSAGKGEVRIAEIRMPSGRITDLTSTRRKENR